ncbi:uncharacterized protein LOC142748301 [Rhinoderma darwinii]|uniref:uncharacterized protein LOC142748301 n=1 Tax=Rhinoderma darwinii TaxID=43563 RepID=UPI003F672712
MRYHRNGKCDQRLLVTALSNCKSIGMFFWNRFWIFSRKWRMLMRNSSFMTKKSTTMRKFNSFFRSATMKKHKYQTCQDTGETKPTYKVGDIDPTSTIVESGGVTADMRCADNVHEGLFTPPDLSLGEKTKSGELPPKRPRNIAECPDSSSSKIIGEGDTSRKQRKIKLSFAAEPSAQKSAPGKIRLTIRKRPSIIKNITVQQHSAVKREDSFLNIATKKETFKMSDIEMDEPDKDIVKASGEAPIRSRKRRTTYEDIQLWTFPPAKRSAAEHLSDPVRKVPGTPELRTPPELMTPDSWRQQNMINLSPEQLSILMSSGQRGMLDDAIINQAQEILQSQFEGFDGLQPAAALLVPGYSVQRKAVQIHYDKDRAHWITTCLKNGKILVADSIKTNNLSPSIYEQINNIYGVMVQEPLKHLIFLNVDQQRNTYDCGVFAVAFAYEFLTDDGDPTAVYHHEMMRNHLISCLQNGRMTAFPKIIK